MPTLSPLSSWPESQIESLLDEAFGPDRHTRTAYAIRTGMSWMPAFSYGLSDDKGNLAGVLQSWPVELLGDEGERTPLIMVGPVAVLPDRQLAGLGRLMMDRLVSDSCKGADAHLMMIGDPEYYGRFWGFTADKTSGWRVPGPVDSRRLLAREVSGLPPLPALRGMVGPRSS